jgi:hypothetical protein
MQSGGGAQEQVGNGKWEVGSGKALMLNGVMERWSDGVME